MVQLGDVLDRGDDEIAILSLLRSLDIQAKANGGAVFQVCDAKSRTDWVHLFFEVQVAAFLNPVCV